MSLWGFKLKIEEVIFPWLSLSTNRRVDTRGLDSYIGPNILKQTPHKSSQTQESATRLQDMSLLLLNSYGKEEGEDEGEDEEVKVRLEVTETNTVTATTELVTSTVQHTTATTVSTFSLVGYEHDEGDEDDEDRSKTQDNLGRAVITTPPPKVATPPPPPTSPPNDDNDNTNDNDNYNNTNVSSPSLPTTTSTTTTATATTTTESPASPSTTGSLSGSSLRGITLHSSPFRCEAFLQPEPDSAVPASLQERVMRFFALKSEGRSINDIRHSKQYKNPDILEKLVQHCGINEIGSNYPPELFDPFAYQPSDYYDAIANEQRRLEEKRPEDRAGNRNIEFTPAIPGVQSGKVTDDKKKSKWDSMDPAAAVITGGGSSNSSSNGGISSVGGSVPPGSQPQAQQLSQVTVVTGTAPTATNAPSSNAYVEYVRKKREGMDTATTKETNKKAKKYTVSHSLLVTLYSNHIHQILQSHETK